MKNKFPGGVWPVMLTPFTPDHKIDYRALEQLIEWYIDKGVDGLFAVCQSSEMFFLSNEESLEIASFVKKTAKGRVPVIASGHTADSIEDQIEQVKRMVETGVDAVILITNRLAKEDEGDDVFMRNLNTLIDHIPEDIPLGFYECPYPYKRLISPDILKTIATTGRFHFLKDTCCDVEQIKEKLVVTKGTNLKIYNANTTTLFETLNEGVQGYSGVMANFQPDLYVWLTRNYKNEPQKAQDLQNFLTLSALIERQNYPANAKYHLGKEGLSWTTTTRTKNNQALEPTEELEVRQLRDITDDYRKQYL